MKRYNNNKGFTLAELLIVVAIIAVLVAISIPLFNTQLEKAREAVDAANIRSQYAQVMSDALTEGTSVNGKDKYGAVKLKQKKDGWMIQTDLHGIFSYIDGSGPKANGTAWVEYNASTSQVILHYEGGSADSPGSGNTFDNSAADYPSGAFTGELGKIYKYNGKLYVCTHAQDFAAGGTPENWYQAQFTELGTDSSKYLTAADIKHHDYGGTYMDLKRGDIYKDGDTYYISMIDGSWATAPDSSNIKTDSEGGNVWVKIKS